MAPTFRSGKGAKTLFNNVDMTDILQGVTIESSVKALDVTTHGDSDENYIAGIRGGTASFEGLFDGTAASTASTATTGAVDSKFHSALAASTQPIVTHGPEGDTQGRRARMFRGEVIKYSAQAPVTDVVRAAADMQVSGRQDYGRWLHALAARTSTSSTLGSVDCGVAAGTTGGGVAHFHMTADSTITSFIGKVQHSSAAASWADLITFTDCDESTGSAAVQRSTVSGTVKRYVRYAITTFTGGGGKSATVAVAFARRNAINL